MKEKTDFFSTFTMQFAFMKKIILTCLSVSLSMFLFAQESDKKTTSRKELRKQRINEIVRQEEEGVIKYKKHLAFGLKLTSDGYGAFIEMARAQSIRRSLLFQLEITERKHPKEFKQQDNGFVFYETPLIYAKTNFFYPVKLGVQQQYLLGNKGNKNGVSISANLGGGFILGLLRPYMLSVNKDGRRVSIAYSQADSALFMNSNEFYGGPNLGTGWSKLRVTPGFYVKPGLRFDYGRQNEMLSAIEVGMTAEYFTKPISQMVLSKQERFFFSAYVSLVFGRRK